MSIESKETTLQEVLSAVNLFVGKKGQNKPFLNSFSIAQKENIGQPAQLPRQRRVPARLDDGS